MRRLMVGVSALLAGLVLAGCGAPAGLDGDLLDDWKPMGEPEAFVPPAGVCYPDDFAETAYVSSFTPVDCTSSHRFETVHVGTFTGAVADRAKPPAQGSADLRSAFNACDGKASDYVGAQWRSARLWLGVAIPSAPAWGSGARWYRCDLVEVSEISDEEGEPVTRTASLKGALTGDSPLLLRCFVVQLDAQGGVFAVKPTDCKAKHNAEYVGVWSSPAASFPAKDRDWLPFYGGCRAAVGRYVGVPVDGMLQYRTGVLTLPAPRPDWQAGNHGVRCYLWMRNRDLDRSLKDAGTAGLPIQYR
ncbi:septum formation family protein [Plantactinospora sp. KBS50]|uniref:septum formation family protein n=1 Tax=Plantactinospora sp. KBS50 TaxID=2024580 RepID=UPI001E2DEFA4|nr:septum formation family protein [Plantactinospora sp. KBS50]